MTAFLFVRTSVAMARCFSDGVAIRCISGIVDDVILLHDRPYCASCVFLSDKRREEWTRAIGLYCIVSIPILPNDNNKAVLSQGCPHDAQSDNMHMV